VLSFKGSDETTPTVGLGVSKFVSMILDYGSRDETFDLTVLRKGQVVEVKGVRPTIKIARGKRGLGIAPAHELSVARVGDVIEKSPAARAGIPGGAVIESIDGKPVATLFDVYATLASAKPDVAMTVKLQGDDKLRTLTLSADEVAEVKMNQLLPIVALEPTIDVQKTSNPLVAMQWGVMETRDLIVKSYVTLRRMLVDQTVSPTNLMGPIEMVNSGAKFAQRGPDWLIWFLAMISANLAVVNFLPIPIVDGGHFTFLMWEKLTGRKPSPKIQEAANWIGLVLLLSLFLFVTYNDIARNWWW
jgi:regulator of sigma E protease